MEFPTGPYDRDDSWQAQILGPDYANQHRPGGPEPYTAQWHAQRAQDAQNAAYQASMNAAAQQMYVRPVPPPQPHGSPAFSGEPTPDPWSPREPADAYSDSPFAALFSHAPPAEPYRQSPWENVGRVFWWLVAIGAAVWLTPWVWRLGVLIVDLFTKPW